MAALPPALVGGIVFFVGACIGSFLNVCIFRLPTGKSIVSPPSACMKCGHEIRWWENIPILSYIFLRGRCSKCGEAISLQYPLVELLNGLFYIGLWYRFGISHVTLIYAFFVSTLVVITFIDLEHYIIPDVISLPGIVAGFLASFILPDITWKDSLMGILVGGGILFLVAWGYYLLTKREGMGGGDIKLLAMIGAFLGWQSIPAVIFLSAAAGSILGLGLMLSRGKDRHHAIPYGPFLAGGAVIYLFYGQEMMNWYLSVLQST